MFYSNSLQMSQRCKAASCAWCCLIHTDHSALQWQHNPVGGRAAVSRAAFVPATIRHIVLHLRTCENFLQRSPTLSRSMHVLPTLLTAHNMSVFLCLMMTLCACLHTAVFCSHTSSAKWWSWIFFTSSSCLPSNAAMSVSSAECVTRTSAGSGVTLWCDGAAMHENSLEHVSLCNVTADTATP